MRTLNQQSIKYHHIKWIYTLVRRGQAVSRVQLSQLTGLSKTTISALVEELIQSNYLQEKGIEHVSSPGRKAHLLQLNGNENFVAVVAWHRHELCGALVDTCNRTSIRCELHMPDNADYVKETVTLLKDNLLPYAKDKRVMGICVVVPSMVDDRRQQIISTVLGLGENNDAVERLRKALPDHPLAILNDTACYAYAEYMLGDIEQDETIFVNIGKGVGAVLLSKGVMFRGANGMTTQFGHSSIDRNGPLCSCGSHGCLERMIGEGALPELVEQFGLAESFQGLRKIRFRDLGALTAAGDPRALALSDHLAGDLAFGLGNLITLFHPQLVVIGGYGTHLGSSFLSFLHKHLEHTGFPQFVQDAHLRFARVDEHAELTGAAGYYLDRHYQFDGSMNNKLILS